MRLKEEQAQKVKYLLATEIFEGMQIVKLTTDNIARVEAMIMTDSGYAKSGDIVVHTPPKGNSRTFEAKYKL